MLLKKQKDTEMYMQGLYFREALLSSVCNNSIWLKKGSEPYKYPAKSFTELMEERSTSNKELLSEDEKKLQTKMLFKNLSLMKANYDLTHPQKNTSQ